MRDRRQRPRRGGLALGLDAIAILLAWGATTARLPAGWIEHGYANGFFSLMNRAFVPVTNLVPFAFGDVELLVVAIALVVWWIRAIRRTPRTRRRGVALRFVAHTIGFAALGIVLFEVLWGFNYRRTTVSARVDFQDARVTDAAVAAFSERIVGTLNANVAAAHAETLDRDKLRAAFEPVVRRLGDEWDVDGDAAQVHAPAALLRRGGNRRPVLAVLVRDDAQRRLLAVRGAARARARVVARRRLHRRRRRELHRNARRACARAIR